jgi:hypothetical protein
MVVRVESSPSTLSYTVSALVTCGDQTYTCGATTLAGNNLQVNMQVDISTDTPIAQVNDTSFIASGEEKFYTQIGPSWAGCPPGAATCNDAITAALGGTVDLSPVSLFIQNARNAINSQGTGALLKPQPIPLIVTNPNNTVINVTTPVSDAPNYYLASYIGGPAEQYYIPYDPANPPDTISIKKEDLDLYLQKIKNLSDENDRLRSLEKYPEF